MPTLTIIMPVYNERSTFEAAIKDALQTGARIYEVPISYRARGREEGKKRTSMDGLRVLRTLVRCKIG